jgi:hypothetical protein
MITYSTHALVTAEKISVSRVPKPCFCWELFSRLPQSLSVIARPGLGEKTVGQPHRAI